jgi:hypothetical protein
MPRDDVKQVMNIPLSRVGGRSVIDGLIKQAAAAQ